MAIRFIPVQSSSLLALGYVPKTKTLVASFKGETFYRYKDVPPGIVALVLYDEESVGKAFNRLVKAEGYAFEKIAAVEAFAE